MFFRWDARVCSPLKSTHCAEGAFFFRAAERRTVQALNAVRGSPSSRQPLEKEVRERFATKKCGSGSPPSSGQPLDEKTEDLQVECSRMLRYQEMQPFEMKLGPSKGRVRERFATKI